MTPPARAPVELVILDCDGVLVDSERLGVKVEARLITALGWPLSEHDVVERFLGTSDEYMQDEIERALGHKVPEWPELYRSEVYGAFRAGLKPVAGIEAALDELTVPYCVASNGTYEKMRLTLGLTGLLERFGPRVFSATDVEHGKPAPDLFLHVASFLGAEPAHCLVVEDSRSGVEAARAAGMRSLGYYGGLTPREWLEGPGTVVFDDMKELVGLVEKSGRSEAV
jgi:HAD superfamily hydrolase (TIGR01509 family)